MQALKTHFAPHLEVSLPRAFECAVYGQPRNNRETMQEYISRQERNFHLLEKEGCKMDETAVGYIVYRQAASSLTESQELRFSAWSEGKYDLKTVQKSRRKLEEVVPEHAEKGTGIAVIDLEQPCLHFIGMSKTVPLCHLTSGHIAIDVCHFEESGFSCPRQAEHAGYGEREFRLTSGPKNVNTCAMLAQLSIASCAAFGHGPSGIPSSKLSEGSSRCQYGHPTKHQSCLKFESGRQTLASAVGPTLSLLGGVVQLLDAGSGGGCFCGLFSGLLRSARRNHQSH